MIIHERGSAMAKGGRKRMGFLEMKIIKNCKSNIVSSNTFLGTNMSSLKCQFWRWFSFCPRWDMYPFPKEGRGTLCIEFFFGVLPRGSRNSSPWDLQKLFEFLSCFFLGPESIFKISDFWLRWKLVCNCIYIYMLYTFRHYTDTFYFVLYVYPCGNRNHTLFCQLRSSKGPASKSTKKTH